MHASNEELIKQVLFEENTKRVPVRASAHSGVSGSTGMRSESHAARFGK